MSTPIKTIPTMRGPLDLTQFYGGDRFGTCIQLTASNLAGGTSYIQLTDSDAQALSMELRRWSEEKDPLLRRSRHKPWVVQPDGTTILDSDGKGIEWRISEPELAANIVRAHNESIGYKTKDWVEQAQGEILSLIEWNPHTLDRARDIQAIIRKHAPKS